MSDAAAEGRTLRDKAKGQLLATLDVVDTALRHRETAFKLLEKNRGEINSVRHVSQETWAKLLYEAAEPFQPQPRAEWSHSSRKAEYRAMGAAIVTELNRRFSLASE